MSAIPTKPTTSRWMDWPSKARILADSLESKPTKTSKTVSVVFEGSASDECAIISVKPEQKIVVKPDPQPVVSWTAWKAAALNRLFEEQGLTGQPSHITAATVLHSERKRGVRRSSGSE